MRLMAVTILSLVLGACGSESPFSGAGGILEGGAKEKDDHEDDENGVSDPDDSDDDAADEAVDDPQIIAGSFLIDCDSKVEGEVSLFGCTVFKDEQAVSDAQFVFSDAAGAEVVLPEAPEAFPEHVYTFKTETTNIANLHIKISVGDVVLVDGALATIQEQTAEPPPVPAEVDGAVKAITFDKKTTWIDGAGRLSLSISRRV